MRELSLIFVCFMTVTVRFFSRQFIDCYIGDIFSSLSCIRTSDSNAAGSRLTLVSNFTGYGFFLLEFFLCWFIVRNLFITQCSIYWNNKNHRTDSLEHVILFVALAFVGCMLVISVLQVFFLCLNFMVLFEVTFKREKIGVIGLQTCHDILLIIVQKMLFLPVHPA